MPFHVEQYEIILEYKVVGANGTSETERLFIANGTSSKLYFIINYLEYYPFIVDFVV